MLDPNMERVIDDEVGVAVVFDKREEWEEVKEGFENRDESEDDGDDEEAGTGTGRVSEHSAGSTKSKADTPFTVQVSSDPVTAANKASSLHSWLQNREGALRLPEFSSRHCLAACVC